MRKLLIIIFIFIVIIFGIYFGTEIYKNNIVKDNSSINSKNNINEENHIVSTVEIAQEEEKTTPNTLIVYKTYFSKCKHYTTKYEDIDVSLVNLTEKELKEKLRDWNIEKFSKEEVHLSKQEKKFCNEHYKIKLENNNIVIYNVNENGVESEYEQTGISQEYLTQEDIIRLNTGIIIYGKENLISAIEDYE